MASHSCVQMVHNEENKKRCALIGNSKTSANFRAATHDDSMLTLLYMVISLFRLQTSEKLIVNSLFLFQTSSQRNPKQITFDFPIALSCFKYTICVSQALDGVRALRVRIGKQRAGEDARSVKNEKN